MKVVERAYEVCVCVYECGRRKRVLFAVIMMCIPHIHRDLERLDTPVYHAKAHSQIVNGIDGCGEHSYPVCPKSFCSSICSHDPILSNPMQLV